MTGRRVRVRATLDPDLIRSVDAYVARHPGGSRRLVIDEALRLWQEREQVRAMERQLREDASHHDDRDRVAWREIKHVTVARRLGRRRVHGVAK